METSNTVASSTLYDPYAAVQMQDDRQGYDGITNEKRGSQINVGMLSSEEGSGKGSKTFYELEQPRPQEPMPLDHGPGKWHLAMWSLRYFLTVILIGLALSLPVIILRNDRDPNPDDPSVTDAQYRNLVFYLFLWLTISWLGACVADMFILAFPYIFRFVAGYINPAHQRYYRVFRAMRKPVVLLGLIIACYISFQYLINLNGSLVQNWNKANGVLYWDDIIYDVLQQCVFWVVGYLLVRILVLYISIHCHYRQDEVKLSHSKEMHDALATLYEASIYLHPISSRHFTVEDNIIRNASGSGHDGSLAQGASQMLRKVGIDGHNVVQFFGKYNAEKNSHWFHPAAPYAVVERALSHPKSAAALAKRIWMSLVVQGQDAFSAEDIAEVLGPYRRDEAKKIFTVIDENECGNIRLDEMVWTVIEAGRVRHSIYQHMHDLNHCINTFDWIALLMLAAVMIFFILVAYVDTIKNIRDTIAYLAIGVGFAIGRTVNHYLQGCIFVFFDHPFDVGDSVNVYNMASTVSVSVVVVRQSLLYTVFRRVDNGTEMQMSNERLIAKRIENISRSGVNKQKTTICVDFQTSFKDLMYLRAELEAFLKANPRDYAPVLGLSIANIHELQKMELSVAFTHKSNWSDEKLRAARSSKFMCALVAAVRKVPLYKPGGTLAVLGDEGRPYFMANISNEEAAIKQAAEKKKRQTARIDAIKPEEREAADEEARRKAEEKKAKDEEAVQEEEKAKAAMAKIPVIAEPTHKLGDEEARSTGVEALVSQVETGLRAKYVSGSGATGPAGMFHR